VLSAPNICTADSLAAHFSEMQLLKNPEMFFFFFFFLFCLEKKKKEELFENLSI